MSDTLITPAAVFDLRAEVEEQKKEIKKLKIEVHDLRTQLRDLQNIGETINEHDDRLDASERRHDAAESTLREMGASIRKLVNGVTMRDLVSERVERHMLAVMAFLKVPVDPTPVLLAAFKDEDSL